MFFDRRINLDVSYYDRTTKNLIVFQDLPPSTGFIRRQSNVGKVEGDGLEIDLGVDIFRSEEADGFNWNAAINFTTNKQIVTELGQDQNHICWVTQSCVGR